MKHRSPEVARIKAAEFKWKSGNYDGEDADPEQVAVWGPGHVARDAAGREAAPRRGDRG